MTKVLRGSSREAWGLLLQNWQSLVKMSAVPIGIYLAIGWMQLRLMANMYRKLLPNFDGQGIDPGFMNEYMRGMVMNSLAGLVGMLALGWLFATIVRFCRSGEAPWLMLDRAGVKAAALTLLYGLGIFLLTLVAYLIGAFLLMVPFGIAAGLANGSGGAAAITALFAFLGVPALIAFLFWFLFRFLVGLPGVALGHSPDFFRDIWPLSRGESWGLPLRMIAVTLLAYIPALAIMLPVMWPVMKAEAELAKSGSDPAASFSLLADMVERMPPYMALMTILFTPFFWFFTLLLATAFQRFYARLQTLPVK